MRIAAAACALLAGAAQGQNILLDPDFEGTGGWNFVAHSGTVFVGPTAHSGGTVARIQFSGPFPVQGQFNQPFAPQANSTLGEVSFWWGHWTAGPAQPQIQLHYGDGTSTTITIPGQPADWTKVDVTPNLAPGKSLISIAILWNTTAASADFDDFTVRIGPPPCYPNCDSSTTPPVLNVNDFACFLNQFAAGNTAANCDGSTTPPVLNVNDFACFLNRFAAGCS